MNTAPTRPSRLLLPSDEELRTNGSLELIETIPSYNIYRSIAHDRAAIEAWYGLIAAIYAPTNRLSTTKESRVLREVALLRQARLAKYVHFQHEAILAKAVIDYLTTEKKIGLEDATASASELNRAVRESAPVDHMGPKIAALCRLIDELKDGPPSQATTTMATVTLGDLYQPLVLVVSVYGAVALYANGMQLVNEDHDPMAGHSSPGG